MKHISIKKIFSAKKIANIVLEDFLLALQVETDVKSDGDSDDYFYSAQQTLYNANSTNKNDIDIDKNYS